MKYEMIKKLSCAIAVLTMLVLAILTGKDGYANNTLSFSHTAFPLHINSVTAIRNRDKTISVNWIVDKEIGTRQYELQRSVNGSSFSTVEIITWTTNNGERIVYDMIDWMALNTDTYYRIKAVSLTGKATYSAIVKVGMDKSASPIRVYPNPVQSRSLQIHFDNQAAGNYKLVLFNKTGQVVWTTTIAVEKGNDVKSFQLDKGISTGTYQLKIVAPGDIRTVEQIIIN